MKYHSHSAPEAIASKIGKANAFFKVKGNFLHRIFQSSKLSPRLIGKAEEKKKFGSLWHFFYRAG